MRVVPIDCIKNGSSLSKTIYDVNGRILLKSGVKIDDSIKNKLKDLKINYTHIIDDYSQNEIKTIIQPELKQKANDVFRVTLNNITIPELNFQYHDQEHEKYIKYIYDLSNDVIEALLSKNELMCSLVDIRNLDIYTYEHSLNVAIISLIMGIGLNMDKSQLLELCISSLLHDIGKVFISKNIITKKGPLTFKEYKTMKYHPQKGYCYLKEFEYISNNSKMAILQHHERIDGSGYPKGLKGDQINIMAKIICIADVYDALSSDRCYREAMCSNEAIDYILSNSGILFDLELVELFTKIFFPYTNDTKVTLSNS